MRTVIALAVVLVGLMALDAPAQDAKPLTPVEAIKKVNEEVTVQMLVKAAKNRLEKRGEIYLDSDENFKDEKNLGIVITKTGAAKLMEAGVNDPAVHFQDKIIRVKGTVIIKEERPRIEVDDASNCGGKATGRRDADEDHRLPERTFRLEEMTPARSRW